jgi:hypothetical protein
MCCLISPRSGSVVRKPSPRERALEIYTINIFNCRDKPSVTFLNFRHRLFRVAQARPKHYLSLHQAPPASFLFGNFCEKRTSTGLHKAQANPNEKQNVNKA